MSKSLDEYGTSNVARVHGFANQRYTVHSGDIESAHTAKSSDGAASCPVLTHNMASVGGGTVCVYPHDGYSVVINKPVSSKECPCKAPSTLSMTSQLRVPH